MDSKLCFLGLALFIASISVVEADKIKCYECTYLVFEDGLEEEVGDKFCEDGEDSIKRADKDNCKKGCSKFTLEFTTYDSTYGFSDVTWHGRGCADSKKDKCTDADKILSSSERAAFESLVSTFYGILASDEPDTTEYEGGKYCECPTEYCNGASLPTAFAILPVCAMVLTLLIKNFM